MKRFNALMIIAVIIFGPCLAFAQETDDDVPYLSDEDIASIEIVLPEDVPAMAPETTGPVGETNRQEPAANEKSRLNVNQPLYHLLILDRTRCALNADISGLDSKSVLFKLKHGKNGYLIALYRSPLNGPIFPVFPNNSRIILNLMTNRRNTITEYINSSAFRRFVTNHEVLTQIKEAIAKNF